MSLCIIQIIVIGGLKSFMLQLAQWVISSKIYSRRGTWALGLVPRLLNGNVSKMWSLSFFIIAKELVLSGLSFAPCFEDGKSCLSGMIFSEFLEVEVKSRLRMLKAEPSCALAGLRFAWLGSSSSLSNFSISMLNFTSISCFWPASASLPKSFATSICSSSGWACLAERSISIFSMSRFSSSSLNSSSFLKQ